MLQYNHKFRNNRYDIMYSFLTGCSATQFTCSNGECVPLTAICNNINECTDGSDEQNCGTVKTYYAPIFLN